jgi:simple sugar transport system ATP-binding protein
MTEAESSAAAVPAVRVRGIEKRFPGVVANHDVDIDIDAGTVHAIVGENGAGKSTLMKILYGVQKPDAGTIEVDGRQVSFHSPSDAIKAGIGMVFQRLHGTGDRARRKIREISDAYGFGLDPDALLEDLGVGQRQRVEILKVLYRGARIIILDEPTAVLVPQEVEALFGNLRRLRDQGHTLVFISHKLDEVLGIADDITVVRRGTTVASVKPGEVTSRQLAELMVGSELPSPETTESTVTDRVILAVEGVALRDAAGRSLLDDISFAIHAGEVLGIAGVEGNGQTELVETVIGIRNPAAGRISLAGVDITRQPTRRRREGGIGYIPEDRQRHGLDPRAPVAAAGGARSVDRPTRRPARQPADRRGVRRPHALDRHDGPCAVRRQPAEVHRRPGDERRPAAAAGVAPDPRCRRRRPGGDLGPDPRGAPQRARGAPDLGRPRRADRPVRHDPRDPARQAQRRVRPAHRDPAGARERDDRSDEGGRLMVKRFGTVLLAPLLAAVIATVVTAAILLATGNSLADFLDVMLSVPKGRHVVDIINNSSVLYLSAIAAAIGFRMNLFNIGVEGQLRVAVFCAAIFAAQGWLPGPLSVVVAIVLAMVIGASWAAIAALLKVTRGVSEVISTIMLNAIAVSLTAYFLRRVGQPLGSTIATDEIPESAWVPGIDLPGFLGEAPNQIFGLAVLAVVVGVAYSLVLAKTRFGFELRATGASPTAALASGVNAKKMVVVSMLLSGAVAGLVGLPILFGDAHYYSTTFQPGLGFAGIAVALLGRNNAIGIALGAVLFAWLDEQSSQLGIIAEISNDVISITQGVLVLSVVIAYEVVRRATNAHEQRAVARALRVDQPTPEPEAAR